jgi:uncharacterized protein with PIN domain
MSVDGGSRPSVIVAILLQEFGYERLAVAIEDAPEIIAGAPAVLEAGRVLSSRLRQDSRRLIHALLRQIRARVVPFDDDHAWAATGVFLRMTAGFIRQLSISPIENRYCRRLTSHA